MQTLKPKKLAEERPKAPVDDQLPNPPVDILFHYWIHRNDADQVSALLNKGQNVNTRDRNGQTGLHLATQLNLPEMVSLLLGYKADPNLASRHINGEFVPLHVAARNNFDKVGRLLLEAKADPNVLSSTGQAPLHEAARHGHEEMVVVLLLAGVDQTLPDKDGFGAHRIAQQAGHRHIAARLTPVPFDMWKHLKAQPDFKEDIKQVIKEVEAKRAKRERRLARIEAKKNPKKPWER